MSQHRKVQGVHRHFKGWKPDAPDHRDVSYTFSLSHRPAAFDLRIGGFLPHIQDQGSLGSCTANSATSAMEFLYKKSGKPESDLSRLFLYYAERVKIEHGDPTNDSGCAIRDTIKSLSAYGTCLESSWPYVISKFASNPPMSAWQEALNHRIVTYYRVTGLTGMKDCLSEGYPVVMGFSVPHNMDSAECAHTGLVKYPSHGDSIIGGHAVMAVGYNDSTKMITFQNSWGSAWGDRGYGYLPYDFFSYGLASDFWTIRREDGV